MSATLLEIESYLGMGVAWQSTLEPLYVPDVDTLQASTGEPIAAVGAVPYGGGGTSDDLDPLRRPYHRRRMLARNQAR